jgi:ParB family transcriptional regulator, chromosome partitioning protein
VSGSPALPASSHQLEIYMEHTKKPLSINLSNLVPSPLNVRRHSAERVEELAALIGSQGLLHPLIVIKHIAGSGNARKMRFPVAAGEYWRIALPLLDRRASLTAGLAMKRGWVD